MDEFDGRFDGLRHQREQRRRGSAKLAQERQWLLCSGTQDLLCPSCEEVLCSSTEDLLCPSCQEVRCSRSQNLLRTSSQEVRCSSSQVVLCSSQQLLLRA